MHHRMVKETKSQSDAKKEQHDLDKIPRISVPAILFCRCISGCRNPAKARFDRGVNHILSHRALLPFFFGFHRAATFGKRAAWNLNGYLRKEGE